MAIPANIDVSVIITTYSAKLIYMAPHLDSIRSSIILPVSGILKPSHKCQCRRGFWMTWKHQKNCGKKCQSVSEPTSKTLLCIWTKLQSSRENLGKEEDKGVSDTAAAVHYSEKHSRGGQMDRHNQVKTVGDKVVKLISKTTSKWANIR